MGNSNIEADVRARMFAGMKHGLTRRRTARPCWRRVLRSIYRAVKEGIGSNAELVVLYGEYDTVSAFKDRLQW